jgi:hypothetical protein
MTRDEIIAKIRANAEAIKAEGVTGLAIFGSRARGDAREDVDTSIVWNVVHHDLPPLKAFVQRILDDEAGAPKA